MKKRILRSALAVIGAIALLVSCNNDKKMAAGDDVERGIILSNMDTTVSPKQDFYQYVNGTWMENTEIPDDQVRWGGFGVLRKSTDADVLEILANAKESGKYAADTDQAKALAIFASELDTVARNEVGVAPLQPALDKIAAIASTADFQKVMTENAAIISQPFLGVAAFSNPNNSAINSAYITPGGLGLPNRDFYVNTDSK